MPMLHLILKRNGRVFREPEHFHRAAFGAQRFGRYRRLWGEDSREKTFRLFAAVRAQLDLLADMPYIGSPCNYSKLHLHSIRKSPVNGFRSFLIYYRALASADGIVVLRIVRHSRDIEPLLEESLEEDD